MSPRSEPGPDRVEQTGDGDRTAPAIRTYLPRLLRLGYRFVLR